MTPPVARCLRLALLSGLVAALCHTLARLLAHGRALPGT
jgi:hypothetical protein